MARRLCDSRGDRNRLSAAREFRASRTEIIQVEDLLKRTALIKIRIFVFMFVSENDPNNKEVFVRTNLEIRR